MTVTTSLSVGRADGSVAQPTAIYAAPASGTPAQVKSIYVGSADGTPKLVYSDTSSTPPPQPIQPTANVSPASQSVNAAVGQKVTFNFTVSGSGGTPPYTYSWFIRGPTGSTIATGGGANGSFTVSKASAGTDTFLINGNVRGADGGSSSTATAGATLNAS